MPKFSALGVGLIVVVLAVGALSVFTVSEKQFAALFQLGQIKRTDYQPGLHFKIPLVNNIRKFDKRILTLDVDPERFLTVEKKNMIVDSFVKWRINDVARFYTAVLGDELQARQRLEQIIKNGMRREFGNRSINEVVSGERAQIMDILTTNANSQAEEIGIKIVDVRIKRVDLQAEVSNSVYRRMEAERLRVAKDFRSRGFEASERIRADADRKRQVILAQAYRDAEKVRGEGDARAADIYAKAFMQDDEFYAFYRSLDAYRRAFSSKDDVLILEPDTEFFRYFDSDKGKQ